MDKNWNRHKSIVNGHHMKNVQQKIDSEYKAYLRHREQVRENTERQREKQAASQRTPNLLNLYSARSYGKPWQKGMTTKTEMPALAGLEDRQNRERQYKSTVSKLPAIKKNKDVLMSQPRITVEKKRLHVHQLSAKPSVTHATGDTVRSKTAYKLPSKAKEPKRPAKHQKQMLKKEFTNGATNDLNSAHQPYTEEEVVLRYNVDHHAPASPPLLNSHELTEEPQTTRRPSSFSWSDFQESEDAFNRHQQRNMNEDDDAFDEDNLSYISDITLPLPIPIRAQTSNTSLHSGGFDCTDSAEEDSIDSENEDDLSSLRQDINGNTEISHSTLHGLEVNTGYNSHFGVPNLGPLQTSQRLHGISPTVTDQYQNYQRNLRDTVEVPSVNASITLSHTHEISPNTSVQNREDHAVPQMTCTNSGEREMDRHSREHFTVPNAAAPLRLSMSSTAPNITLLRENLDLVFHTLSMQRQSDRRNLENTVLTPQNKVAEKLKSKTDPEKLKKLQESLLQEDSEEEGDLCRICLMGGETTENLLIAPCQCSGSLQYVHTECLKRWLLAKIKSGAELSTVRTCEMCKQKVECEIEGFNLSEHYRKHQETQATLNPSLYLVLLLHLYQQRYEELLQVSHTRDRVSELSRRFLHFSLGRREHSRDNEQDS